MVLAIYNIKKAYNYSSILQIKMPREGTFWGVLKSHWGVEVMTLLTPLATALVFVNLQFLLLSISSEYLFFLEF